MINAVQLVDALADPRQETSLKPSAAVLAAALDELSRRSSEQPAAYLETIVRYEELAILNGKPALAARAVYVRAQGTAASGDFPLALTLIESAAAALRTNGLPGAALRTNLGRAHLLNEMGRHAEALDACDAIVRGLATSPCPDLDHSSRVELAASAELNRGLCFEFTSQWERALQAYGSAEAGFLRIGDSTGLGEVLGNRGFVLAGMGRVAEAQAVFHQAIEMLDPDEDRRQRCVIMIALAETLVARGDYVDALRVLAESGDLLDDVDTPLELHDRQIVAARAYEALNLHGEALGIYRDASAFFLHSGMAVEHARAEWGAARVLLAMGDATAARRHLSGVVEAFHRSGHRQWLAGAYLDAASAHRLDGALAEAKQAAHEASELAELAGAPIEQLRAELMLADICDADGDRAGSEYSVKRAAWIAEHTDLAPLNLLADQAFGLRHLDAGRRDQARTHLERAAVIAERLHSGLSSTLIGRRFMLDKLDAFDALIELSLQDFVAMPGAVRANAVLAATERARRRRLGELSRRSSEQLDGNVDTSALAQELDAVYGDMLNPVHADTDRLARLKSRAGELESSLSRAQLDGLRVRSTKSTDAASDGIPVLDEAILSWYCLGNEVVAVVVVDGQVFVRRNAGRLDVVRAAVQRLDAQWQHLRADYQLIARHAARFERAARSVLRELHDELVLAVADLLPFGSPTQPAPIVIAAHGPLHGVPFHALHDGTSSLIERYVVSYTPSVADYLWRSELKTSKGASLVLGAADELAPAMVDEARAVASRLRNVSLHSGLAATSSALLDQASGAAVVHLACHALFRSDNPMFSSLRLADRWVQASELLSLDLTGALVTLSACDSGRSHAGHGEELAGLARAVLGAGARTMVASLWPADDASTVELMNDFYLHLGERGVAAALREAALAQATRTPHPYHWAPFVAVGGR